MSWCPGNVYVCYECEYREKLQDTDNYFEFIVKHNCSLSHKGLAETAILTDLTQHFMAITNCAIVVLFVMVIASPMLVL